ncbi:hypothetical protein O7635_35370 [Asanoa sp. WMMD1127]|uniref:hypothetical protein n=1 Tax=Asanoa sp. WMMD1127 TaxID=3016107 RepID=UPI002416EEEF|nr:hypothetical protein [Asanoa sp. WMMD1127]MDG4827156.1 hypothetical protein [Asanoa sp. WMMD1127]
MAPQPDPSSARGEAERLVASVLAMARRAGDGPGLASGLGALGQLTDVLGSAFGGDRHSSGGTAPGGHAVATGSAECCVCPICRVIVALRDPSPEFAERLATGAGDFAAGVASLLRAVNSSTAVREPQPPAAPAPRFSDDEIWRAATRTRDDVAPAPAAGDVWAAATAADRAADDDVPPPPRKPMARKAVKRTAPPAPRSDDDA